MQGPAEGRSTAIGEESQRSGHPGARQGRAHGRSGAVEEKSIAPATPAQCKARSRGGPATPRAMQSQAQGRSGTEQSRGGVTEQRSVASPTLSPGGRNPRAQYRDAVRCSRNDCGHPPPMSRLRVRCRQGRAGDHRSGDAGVCGGSSGLINRPCSMLSFSAGAPGGDNGLPGRATLHSASVRTSPYRTKERAALSPARPQKKLPDVLRRSEVPLVEVRKSGAGGETCCPTSAIKKAATPKRLACGVIPSSDAIGDWLRRCFVAFCGVRTAEFTRRYGGCLIELRFLQLLAVDILQILAWRA